MKVPVCFLVHDDHWFLSAAIRSWQAAGPVYVLLSRTAWNGTAGDWKKCAEIAKAEGAILIEGEWTSEADHRAAALMVLASAKFSHALIPDADEVIEPSLLDSLVKIAASDLADRVYVHWDTYWKSPEYVIRPRERFTPLELIKVCAVKHLHLRDYEGGRALMLGPEHGLVHHLSDTLGSTSALLDATQSTTDSWQYWPYGEVVARTGTSTTPFTFIGSLGYFQDGLNDRYYVRARDYRATYTRWLTVDELWPDELAYTYVDGKPTTETDPSGMCLSSVDRACALSCSPYGHVCYELIVHFCGRPVIHKMVCICNVFRKGKRWNPILWRPKPPIRIPPWVPTVPCASYCALACAGLGALPLPPNVDLGDACEPACAFIGRLVGLCY